MRKFGFLAPVLFVMLVSYGGSSSGNDIYSMPRYGKLRSARGIVGLDISPPTGRPIPRSQWNAGTKLWLARSVVGEANFDAYDEHIAIAWVYATIHKQKGMSLEKIIRSYSAAVKKKSTGRRSWILDLQLDGEKPEGWPERLNWKMHRYMWKKVLSNLEDWARGKKPNPVYGANHYGGKMDSPGIDWVKLETPFKNRFYIAKPSD